MKPHNLIPMNLRLLKLGLGLLSIVLGTVQIPAAAPEINNARAAMRSADYQLMVSTLNPYLTSNPGDQEARLLRAIGTAGVIAKNNLAAFLIQKGATRATIDPLNNSTVDSSVKFPIRPTMTTGKSWNKNGDSYTLPAGGDSNANQSYLLAYRNTGSSPVVFTINITADGYFPYLSLIWNGDYVGYLGSGWFYAPESLVSNITQDGSGNITSFTITLAAGEWLTFEAYVYSGSGGVTFTSAAPLPASIEVKTGTVPYDSAPAFAPNTNFSDIITFLGAQQTAIDSILTDLASIQSVFSTTFSTSETGVAGTLIVEYADVQMLAGLLKSSQAIHRLLKTYNTDVDLTNSNLIEQYQSTITGEFMADDFIVDHANLLRPTADDPADRTAARNLISAAADMLLAVENTLFTRPAPDANSSYIFAIDTTDGSPGQKRTDFHNNLVKLKEALTGNVALDTAGTDLPATAQASLAPLFATAPLDLRALFEFSSRGILAGGSKKFLASSLLTGVSEYQWENILRNSNSSGGRWALGGYTFEYYSHGNLYDTCFQTTIERGAPASIPYYPEGALGSNAPSFQYQWQLRKEDVPRDNWWEPIVPVFEPITSATTQTLNMALLTDDTHRGAYLTVRYPAPNSGELTGNAAIWVDWADSGSFNPQFTITRSPLSRFFKEGETINLWVGTDTISKDMQYQWYKGDAAIPGATSALFTIANATAAAAGEYYVAISNRAVTVPARSERARVVLWTDNLALPAAPVFTGHPQNTIITAGQNATFTAAASGNPAPTLQWQSFTNGTTWTNIAGATSTTLTLTVATTAMNGTQYRCVASNSVQSGVPSNAATLTVNPDPATATAQQLKNQLESSGTALVTVTGTVDLSLVGGAIVGSGKTIEGTGTASHIAGNLTITANTNETIIRGISFATGTLSISGANDIDISHCTFTDTPVVINGNSDNIAFSWNKFTATEGGAGGGSAMRIDDSGASTGILLDHNYFADGLKTDIPAATNSRVVMFNNYITATGNTTATIVGSGAQILSERNIYQGTHNPLAKQGSGKLRALNNYMSLAPANTGTIDPGEDTVFVPAYSRLMYPAGSTAPFDAAAVAALIAANAGNTNGKNSATPPVTANATARITAIVTGAGSGTTATAANVPTSGSFTLTANATNFTPATARQWYRDNFAITGETASTYNVTNATTADAGAYAVALTTTASEIVTSAAFTVSIGALDAPVITMHPASQTITAGGNVTFNVAATGQILAYQWQKNSSAWANISGATTTSYTITNAQQSDATSYRVLVSNPSGTATSNAAALTVNPAGGGGNSGGGGGAVSLPFLAMLALLCAWRAAKAKN